ncbi:MAG: DUF3857 domain-containing transglutaminase family protein [Cyanobacteria bacterium P01_A01_bin.84]
MAVSHIPEELKKNANAVVRLDEMRIHLISTRKMFYKVREVVTVMNRLGNNHARTRVYYDKEKRIKNIEAYIYDGFGREIEHVKRKDFQDVSAADGFSLYTDDRLLTYTYTPVQYPYTVEFTYEVETSDTGVFPSWYFLSGYLGSVEKSIYAIQYDSEALKPIIKENRLSDLDVSVEEKPGMIVYKANNIPAIKRESLSPPFSAIVPKLSARLTNFSFKGYEAEVNNWNDMGKWMQDKLLEGRAALSEETKSKARLLVKGVEDDLEKAKIIYKYVQENTRYISVQIGIGGLQPISAIDVDRVKYGDCKGLSNYTMALLNVVGVKSYYTTVQAGETKEDFEEDFADLIQGNHIILAIPYNDRYYWIDCTSQIHPFGFIGDFTDDRKVLIINDKGGKIVKTTAYLNEDNYQNISAVYSLNEEGGISGDITIKTEGIRYNNRFYLEDETQENILKHYKKYWSNINNLEVKQNEFNNDRDSIVFVEKVRINASNYATKSGGRILFAANVFNNKNSIPDRYRNRKLPFEIQRGFLDEDEFMIHLPEGYTIEAIPDEQTIENEFGSYQMSARVVNDKKVIAYKRKLLIREGAYPKEKYKLYRDFVKATARADNARIVLLKNNP